MFIIYVRKNKRVNPSATAVDLVSFPMIILAIPNFKLSIVNIHGGILLITVLTSVTTLGYKVDMLYM